MIHGTELKVQPLYHPAAVAADNDATSVIDTKGFGHCTVIVHTGTVQGSAGLELCSVTEGATATPVTAISALTVGDAACLDVAGTAATLAMTDDADCVVMHINLANRERYLRLNINTVTGGASNYSAVALLSRSAESSKKTNASLGTPLTGTLTAIISVSA